jgi:hypothetical protein
MTSLFVLKFLRLLVSVKWFRATYKKESVSYCADQEAQAFQCSQNIDEKQVMEVLGCLTEYQICNLVYVSRYMHGASEVNCNTNFCKEPLQALCVTNSRFA